MAGKLAETVYFLKGAMRNTKQAGALFPTSSRVGKYISKVLAEKTDKVSLKVIEIGAGTGRITKSILESLEGIEIFTICEINPLFVKYLETLINLFKQRYPEFSGIIKVFSGDFEKLDCDEKYTVFISSIPIWNRTSREILNYYRKIKSLASKGSFLIQVEYFGLGSFNSIFSESKRKVLSHIKQSEVQLVVTFPYLIRVMDIDLLQV